MGAVEIDRDKQIKVNYPNIATGVAEPYLIKGLYSHFDTSGLPKFTGLVSKLNGFAAGIGLYSQALLEFLKLVVEKTSKYRAKVDFADKGKSGFTKWFILTAWIDALCKAGGQAWILDSWYKQIEPNTASGLWQIKCGAFIIGTAQTEKTIKIYANWHKILRSNSSEHQAAKDINVLRQELEKAKQEIQAAASGIQ